MKRIVSLIVLVLCAFSCAACAQFAVFSSYRDNVRYDFRITREQLNQSPKWMVDEPNPPLSPRRAQAVGTTYIHKLFTDSSEWRVFSVELVPLANDKWVYLIAFAVPRVTTLMGCADCLSTTFKVVVLMDGTKVQAGHASQPPSR